MTFIAQRDFSLEVSKGNIEKHSVVNKFGENGDVAKDTTEDIWDGGGTYTYPSTADITHLSMSLDQVAARDATIEVQGLDTDWELVVQDVNLGSSATTSAVALTTPLRRVFRMKVNADVVLTSDLLAHNVGGGTSYAKIIAGNNQTLMSLYTIPAGKAGYVRRFYASFAATSVKDPYSVLIRSWARDNENGYAFQLKHSLSLDKGGTTAFERVFDPPLKMPAKTDVRMSAHASGSAAYVSSGFDLFLVDD